MGWACLEGSAGECMLIRALVLIGAYMAEDRLSRVGLRRLRANTTQCHRANFQTKEAFFKFCSSPRRTAHAAHPPAAGASTPI